MLNECIELCGHMAVTMRGSLLSRCQSYGGESHVGTGVGDREPRLWPSTLMLEDKIGRGGSMQTLGPTQPWDFINRKFKGEASRATATNIKVQPPNLCPGPGT